MTCQTCQTEYTPSRTSLKRNKSFFCSNDCYWQSLRKPLSSRICEHCDKAYLPNRNENLVQFSGRRYCSLKCRALSQKPKFGPDNPNWKQGASKDYATYYHNRRTRLSKAGGAHTHLEWQQLKAKYRYMCLCCKKAEPEVKLSRDHIIPVCRGGTSDISNIQPLCRSCNSRKHDKSISYISNLTFI